MALSRMGAVGRTSGALPSALRSAAALQSASRRSFSWFSWGKEEEEDPKFFERQLHRLYSERVVPLEKKYNFPKFATPALRKADFLAAPMVLLLGQYSTGKTSMIQYLTGKQVPGAHVGPEPTTDKFVAVMHGDTERQTPGHAACSDTDLPFHSLTAYGAGSPLPAATSAPFRPASDPLRRARLQVPRQVRDRAAGLRDAAQPHDHRLARSAVGAEAGDARLRLPERDQALCRPRRPHPAPLRLLEAGEPAPAARLPAPVPGMALTPPTSLSTAR